MSAQHFEFFIGAGLLQQVQCRQSRRNRQWVAAQGAGLIDRPQRGDLIHQVGAATVGAHRQPAAQHFSQRGQVGAHTEALLRAAVGEAETGDDFIEEQQGAVLLRDLAQTFQKTFLRQDAAHVADHRLDDDGGDFASLLGKDLFECVEVVVGQREGEADELFRHAGGVGQVEGGQAGASLGQQAVVVAVVAALELDDGLPAGGAARQANGRHGGLGAGADQANLFNGRKGGADFLRQLDFSGGGRAEASAAAGGLLDRGDNVRVGVAEDERSPGTYVINVGAAVHIGEPSASAALNEGR